MHLVIATRDDPHLPLARLRAQRRLTELRAADLRFTASEAAAFLNQAMGLSLSAADVAALETRTEGWVAGLQLAAISLQGHPNPARFISEFTGSHRFVVDYLAEEVLRRQPERIQAFLLRTSTAWKLGFAYQLKGNRAEARQAYIDVISVAQASGNLTFEIMATIGPGNMQEAGNQLYRAAETYRRVLQLLGESPLPVVCEAHLGLARIGYEWNDSRTVEQQAQQSL